MDKIAKHEKELEEAKGILGIGNGAVEENELEEHSDLYENELNEENEIKLSTGEILNFNTDIMTGKKIIELKDRYFKVRKRKAGMVAEADDYYFALVACDMTGKRMNYFLDLKARDFKLAIDFVKVFLLED